MHELSLCRAIADTVTRYADGQRVQRVDVRIGYFRQVVPDSLMFSWELLTDGTALADCELVVEQVPAVIECRSCRQQTVIDWPVLLCSRCASRDVELLSGDEFLIASITRTKEAC
ncbi:MAG: hydrogenase maturation nickel metallochaperone HypA [Acidimicrobiales bacterium]|jgi:hydrogenase nickel incorporation protein HypA/HybF